MLFPVFKKIESFLVNHQWEGTFEYAFKSLNERIRYWSRSVEEALLYFVCKFSLRDD